MNSANNIEMMASRLILLTVFKMQCCKVSNTFTTGRGSYDSAEKSVSFVIS